MYDLIYNFLLDNLFNSNSLNTYQLTLFGQSTTLQVWLCHTSSIILIGLIIVFLVLFVKWFFKLGAGLLTLR